MIVLLLQHQHELPEIASGLRIPAPAEEPASPTPLPIGSALSILFDKGLHFDDEGTCYLWHRDGTCYAIPLGIWNHPASAIRALVLPHWPYGEQLSFWRELWEERVDGRADGYAGRPKRRPALRALRREEVLPPEG